MATTALSAFVLIPLFPHLSETSVGSCLVVLFSPYLSFGLLDLENCVQSWYHTIYPLQLTQVNQNPYLMLISLVCLFLSPQIIDICTLGLPENCFSYSPTFAPFSSPQSSGPYYTSLSPSIFSSSLSLIPYPWSLVSPSSEILSYVTIITSS